MRLKERLNIALPELLRPDGRALVGGGALSGITLALTEGLAHGINDEMALATVAASFVTAKVACWLYDLCSLSRLRQIEIERGQAELRRGRDEVKRLRKEHFSRNIFTRKRDFLEPEDRILVQRVEENVDEIERQYRMANPLLQRSLLHIIPSVVQQALSALEAGRKLSMLLEFLSREDLARLEAEELYQREQAQQAPVGPLGSLHSQTHRFKAQQIANVRNAQKDTALYRAQIRALEAGLSIVRGRIASMISIDRADITTELEALDAEITALDDGIRMAARATSGDLFHAGGRFEAKGDHRIDASPPNQTEAPESNPAPGAARRTTAEWTDPRNTADGVPSRNAPDDRASRTPIDPPPASIPPTPSSTAPQKND